MIIRTSKISGQFFIAHKGYIQDARLSAKAKGIMTYLLSLPDDWEIHIKEIAQHFKDGRDSIASGLKELEAAGYLKKTRKREKGKFKGWEYTLFEVPETEKTENGKTENGKTDFGKSAPTNNKYTNNDLTNNNKEQHLKNADSPENNQNDENKEKDALINPSASYHVKIEAEKKTKKSEIDPELKDLRELVLQRWRFWFEREIGLKFTEYGKVRKIGLEFAKYLKELKTQGWADEKIKDFLDAVILMHLLGDSKIEPSFIFMRPSITHANLRSLKQRNKTLWQQIINKIQGVKNEI